MDSILGRTILGYRVVEKIGSGGFGNVYRVERNNIVGNTTRALKVITLPGENEYIEILNSMGGDREKTNSYFKKELDRVLNEIRVFSLISEKDNHNIVSYYESDVEQTGEFRYNIYILMEMLTPLTKWLQENNLTVGEGLKIGIDIASGLSICHENNIIHRDIKLSNIFVSKDGTFKLGDFGVSKRMNDTTMAGTLKGTPNYIAPEIYIGQEKYNSSVDNYSLGILLYYLFNKKRFPYYPDFPYEYSTKDEDRAFYKRMKYEELSNPVCAPKTVARIIKKAISKPDERYRKTEQLLEDLMDAKNSLTEDELNAPIGFEPVTKESPIVNEKEAKLVENLYGQNDESISFEQYGITMEDTDSIKGQNALTDDEVEKNNRAKIDYNYVTDEKNGNKLSSGGSEINKQELTNESSSEKSKYKWLLIGAIIITCNVMIILWAVYCITNKISNNQEESNRTGNIAQTTSEKTTITETTAAQTTVQETTSQQPVATTVPATTKAKKKKAKNTTTTKASSNNSESSSKGTNSKGSNSNSNSSGKSGSSSKKNNDEDFNFKNVVE